MSFYCDNVMWYREFKLTEVYFHGSGLLEIKILTTSVITVS